MSEFPGDSFDLNTMVTVAGTNVYVIANFGGTNDPVSTKDMLKLINRIKKLR